MSTQFNCAKQKHIWKTEKEDGDNCKVYLPEWFSEETKEAMTKLHSGEAQIRRKIDGSCGAIICDQFGEWSIYQRYDDKKNKFNNGKDIPEGYINLPNGENDKGQHHYYLKLINRIQKSKGEQKIADSLYEVLDRCKDSLEKKFYSVELVGPNFNKTPGVEKNGIAIHERQLVKTEIPALHTPEEWFEWLKNYFLAFRDEGLIVSYKSCYWKIHSAKFCPESKDYNIPELL